MAIEASPDTKVVIDTTTLLQSIPTRGPYHRIIEAFVEGSFHLVVSHQIMLEYFYCFLEQFAIR